MGDALRLMRERTASFAAKARAWSCSNACPRRSQIATQYRVRLWKTLSPPLPIGSVKTNVGHLETAAGVAGLLKAMLVLQHRQIPPSLHFNTPNTHIAFEKLKLRVPTTVEPFPETDGERLAGVNSFGFGGANAHVILAESPMPAHVDHGEPWPERAWPMMLSARSEDALRGYAMKLAE